MEHEFIYLSDSRQYLMRLPAEQNALQTFLLDEFAPRAGAFDNLIANLSQLKRFDEWQFDGREYSLRVDAMEVFVYHQSMQQQFDDTELEPELTTDDANLSSECGLEDLLSLLRAWQQFLPTR